MKTLKELITKKKKQLKTLEEEIEILEKANEFSKRLLEKYT